MMSTSLKTPCFSCGKNNGLFKCEGCEKKFCVSHVQTHRQQLNQQLEEIVVEYDTLRNRFQEDSNDENHRIASVDIWEQQSIDKIHQISNKFRREVIELRQKSNGIVVRKFQELSETIKVAQENDDFFESDLLNWNSMLVKLRGKLTEISTSIEVVEDRTTPLIFSLQTQSIDEKCISQVSMSDKTSDDVDFFDYSTDNISLGDNNCLAIHSRMNGSGEVRGRKEYSSGVHRCTLLIEKNPLGTWIFLGIISKSAPHTFESYNSRSCYGWVDYDDTIICGVRQGSYTHGQFRSTKQEDSIQLDINCDHQTITYENLRTRNKQTIDIDLKACPFPWLLHLNMFGADDQVRLLS